MNLKSFKGSGSTPSRRRFWDQVTEAVNASQKIAGQNVTVDEYPGKGSVVNVPDQRNASASPPVSECPTEDPDTISITFSGIGSCCIDTLTRSFDVTHPEDLNTGFTLTNNDLHSWTFTATAFTEVERYDDFGCTGDHEPVEATLNIQVLCDVDGWHARITLDGAGISSSIVFDGVSPSLIITNTISCGGSATVTL